MSAYDSIIVQHYYCEWCFSTAHLSHNCPYTRVEDREKILGYQDAARSAAKPLADTSQAIPKPAN